MGATLRDGRDRRIQPSRTLLLEERGPRRFHSSEQGVITPVPRYRPIRKSRGNPWNSESSARANKARWDRDRERRDAEQPQRIRELAEIAAANLPHRSGDILGTLQWTDAATGRVRRWTIRIGDRIDQVTASTSDGRRSRSMGWTRLLDALRGYLAGRKAGAIGAD